jgi:Protein of unknown function (DUF3455)
MKNRKIILVLSIVFCSGTNLAETLSVPNIDKLQMTLHAKGEQIYSCEQAGHAYNWKWQAPTAKLYDDQQAEVGSHSAGPTWTHKDGSSVTAKLLQKVPAPDASAAPWLLLEATANNGKGAFADTGYIMRINTQGGATPSAEECDDKRVGTEKRVAYSADYNFYRK